MPAGVTIAVQFGAVPPKITLVLGMSVVFAEVIATLEVHDNVESISLIVNAIAALAVP